ncbi:MAG: hypothetical protein P4L56_06670, partial [Candidatus Sulfopaludibacter sp.]|nr:hypothetical protein [Candidatus Sulfopaludibacter sp.]
TPPARSLLQKRASGVDDGPQISLPFPVLFPEWVTSAGPYWSTLAKRPRFGVSKSSVNRHHAHITSLIQSATQERAEGLESDITRAEGRVESLYAVAENVLAAAVKARDPRSAMQAIRTAVSVLGEARALAELRGAQERSTYRSVDIDAQLEDLLTGKKVRNQNRAEVLADLEGPVQ